LAIQPAVFFAQAVERPKPGFTLSIKRFAPSTLSSGYPADYHKLLVTYSNISDAARKTGGIKLDSLDMLNMIVLRDGAPADELPANAAFNVAGPTSVTVTPSGQEFFIGDNRLQ